MGSQALGICGKKWAFLFNRVFLVVPQATPPSVNCVRAQRTIPSLVGERMLMEGTGCPVLTPPPPPGSGVDGRTNPLV